MIARFLALPIVVNLMAALGGGVRFYRTVFVEEIHRDYVRTARAKGAGDARIMGRHVLRNAMIPILTNVVMEIRSCSPARCSRRPSSASRARRDDGGRDFR